MNFGMDLISDKIPKIVNKTKIYLLTLYIKTI